MGYRGADSIAKSGSDEELVAKVHAENICVVGGIHGTLVVVRHAAVGIKGVLGAEQKAAVIGPVARGCQEAEGISLPRILNWGRAASCSAACRVTIVMVMVSWPMASKG